jgi:hypothetical protein
MPLKIAFQFANPSSSDSGKLCSRAASCIAKILYIAVSLAFGVALVCLPWLGFWENNYLLYLYPQIRPIVTNPYLKGAVLGLGIANILIGIHEIAHFKEASK